jgi:hypothetical protein
MAQFSDAGSGALVRGRRHVQDAAYDRCRRYKLRYGRKALEVLAWFSPCVC